MTRAKKRDAPPLASEREARFPFSLSRRRPSVRGCEMIRVVGRFRSVPFVLDVLRFAVLVGVVIVLVVAVRVVVVVIVVVGSLAHLVAEAAAAVLVL